MAFNAEISKAEEIIGYEFKDKGWITRALQATARAEVNDGTGTILDGNHLLSLLGQKVIELAVVDEYVRNDGDGRDADDALAKLTNSSALNKIAASTGLDQCILLPATGTGSNSEDSHHSPDILKHITTAVLGGVWRDTEEDLEAVKVVMHNIGIFAMIIPDSDDETIARED